MRTGTLRSRALTPEQPCPLCTGKFQVCEALDTGAPFITHTAPGCPAFLTRGVTEYLRAVNDRLAAH